MKSVTGVFLVAMAGFLTALTSPTHACEDSSAIIPTSQDQASDTPANGFPSGTDFCPSRYLRTDPFSVPAVLAISFPDSSGPDHHPAWIRSWMRNLLSLSRVQEGLRRYDSFFPENLWHGAHIVEGNLSHWFYNAAERRSWQGGCEQQGGIVHPY